MRDSQKENQYVQELFSLPVKNSALYSTGGHINPVSLFYVGHAILDAGFADVTAHIDRCQRSSIPKLILLYPWIKLMGILALRRERVRYKTIDDCNLPLVRNMNDVKILLGRTIITKSTKPS